MPKQHRLSLNAYAEKVFIIFQKLFADGSIETPPFHQALVNAIVHCFHMPTQVASKEKKALLILELLFFTFTSQFSPKNPFHLADFLQKYALKKSEVKRLLIGILYGLYYGDVELTAHQKQNHRENFHFLMLQLVAEKVSTNTLRGVLRQLSLDQTTSLLCYAFKHYREGSYLTLRQLEELLLKNQLKNISPISQQRLASILFWIKRKYYDLQELLKLLLAESTLDDSLLEKIHKHLENHALAQTHALYALFDPLVNLMVHSPISIYDEIETLKKQMIGPAYQASAAEKEAAERQKEQLTQRFTLYFSHPYSFQAFQDFARLFGLSGYPARLHINEICRPEQRLIEKLTLMQRLFSSPSLLMQTSVDDIQGMFSLILTIILHLEAMQYKPMLYKKGLEQMLSAIPTSGKDLALQPTLPTILTGLDQLVQFINARTEETEEKITLRDYPLIVFDQSKKELYDKNSRYIQQLNRHYKSCIIHVTQEEALGLSQKIKMEWAIRTSRSDGFGFAGARNCVFLLAPVIKRAFAAGKKSMKEILEMKQSELLALFNAAVLGGDTPLTFGGETLFMCDDDMAIPDSNLFSHILYSAELGGLYAFSFGYYTGRNTKYSIKFRNLKHLLTHPRDNFIYTEWTDHPKSVLMSEVVCKPRICLNLPFGHEESHLLTILESNLLSKPSIHLCGTRYPTLQIPTHYFVGLEETLKAFIPHSITIAMVCFLADPGDNFNRCVLPWNDKSMWTAFYSLREVFEKIVDVPTKKEMQKHFWKNMHEFLTSQKQEMIFQQDISDLLNENIKEVLEVFKKQHALSRHEKDSLDKIEEIYRFYHQDAVYLKELGERVVAEIKACCTPENWYESCIDAQIDMSKLIDQVKETMETQYAIRIVDYPLTENFYLLMQVIGAAQFNAHVDRTLRPPFGSVTPISS